MLENFRIRVFRTVAHHLNFSRAAEELLLTPLEDEIGVPLFDRGGGRIALTALANPPFELGMLWLSTLRGLFRFACLPQF